MMRRPETAFVFALTNVGSEKALKGELMVLRPGWRAGYQRRGFVTLKAGEMLDFAALDVAPACARRLCLSLGKVAIALKLGDLEQVADKAQWFAALTGMGFDTIRLQQLSVHRQELALLALKGSAGRGKYG